MDLDNPLLKRYNNNSRLINIFRSIEFGLTLKKDIFGFDIRDDKEVSNVKI